MLVIHLDNTIVNLFKYNFSHTNWNGSTSTGKKPKYPAEKYQYYPCYNVIDLVVIHVSIHMLVDTKHIIMYGCRT